MPLICSSVNQKFSTILVQLEDATQDLTGDVGAIGRLHTRKEKGIMLDIKGTFIPIRFPTENRTAIHGGNDAMCIFYDC